MGKTKIKNRIATNVLRKNKMVTIIQTDRQLEIVNAGLKPNTPTKKL